MEFTKIHGIGNDYLYINALKKEIKNPSELAVKISDRHFGVGSDGIILVLPSKIADAKMRIFNADGSEAEMCGNGIRGFAKYIYEKKIVNKRTMKIETGRGILKVNLTIKSNKMIKAKVDMGTPILKGKLIPTIFDDEIIIHKKITVLDKDFYFTSVSMGNPHCIIYVEDVDKFPVEKYGPIIESHNFFPNKVNVEFVQIINKNEVKQRTWERGSGETLACGTGASAVCVAGVLNNLTDKNLLNHLLGGDLELTWEGDSKSSVFMTGPAEEVFTGKFEW